MAEIGNGKSIPAKSKLVPKRRSWPQIASNPKKMGATTHIKGPKAESLDEILWRLTQLQTWNLLGLGFKGLGDHQGSSGRENRESHGNWVHVELIGTFQRIWS